MLTDGGTALLFWGFIAVTIGMIMVYASLAEMASMYDFVLVCSICFLTCSQGLQPPVDNIIGYVSSVFALRQTSRLLLAKSLPSGLRVRASQISEDVELPRW